MVFDQKPRKPIMFTANAHKNTQGYFQPNKDSIGFNLPLHTHDEDHFHHPQVLKLAYGTHIECILNRDKKHNETYQKVTKKVLQRQNLNKQIDSRFTPATDLKIGTFVLIPNFTTQKRSFQKITTTRKKGPYHIIDKPTDVTYKLTDLTRKEIVQHRNKLLPFYPKEYALREITELNSFTVLKTIQNNSDIEPNQNTDKYMNPNPTQQKELVHQTSLKPETKTTQKERKNKKMIEKNNHYNLTMEQIK